MPMFSDYSLYSPFASAYSPYSPVVFRSGFAPSTGYSGGGGGSSPYAYTSSAGRSNRYGPLLTTIVESGLSPAAPRRGPRSAPYVPPVKSNYTPKTSSYTPLTSSYVPLTSSRVPYQRPVRVDTENIDVSTPRKPRRIVEPEKTYEKKVGDSDTRGTIKRGRTVVRMHTKHLKENPDVDKRKKMTPGERLKEKFMIRDKESERKKKEEEEERLREIERQEAASRRRRLMCVEQQAPVVPQIKSITEDLKKDAEKTPENSESSGSDTETEETEAVKRLTRKKKRRKSSVKKEPPVAPPRVKRSSFDTIVPINIEDPEPKKLTVKGKERMKSVKCGGISKRGGTKKNIILPPKSSTTVDDVMAPIAPQRGRKCSADESPVEQAKMGNKEPKWPQSAPNKKGVANKTKTDASQQRKSEPFGDTMKSFSNFFMNFGKKTTEVKSTNETKSTPETKTTTEIENKEPETKIITEVETKEEPKLLEESKEEALKLIVKVEPEHKELDTKQLREDSTESENVKRDRGISNIDFKPKQSVKFRENKVSDRLARFVEKKDFNKDNNAKLMKALSQAETPTIENCSENGTDIIQNTTIVNSSTESNEVAIETQSEKTEEIVAEKEKPIAVVSSENESATRKSPAKSLSNKPKSSDAETTQKTNEKAGKKAQSSVTAEHVEQPKQDQPKPAAEGSPPKDFPSAKKINQPTSMETKAKASNIANENTKSKLAEERVDLKPLASKTEEEVSAKIGNGDKATANSEQVETVCQIKDASTSVNGTGKSETDLKKSSPPPLENGEKKEKVQTPTQKKFPWLNKKEESKISDKPSALKIEPKKKSSSPKAEPKSDKESQLAQVTDIKSDINEVNAVKDKKYPWLAKKLPSPAQQPDKISMPEAIKKDTAAEEPKQTLETDAVSQNKVAEKITPAADSPTCKKFAWQKSAEIAESADAKKSPATPVKKKDAGKVFLFDKETVDVVTDGDKKSTASGVGTEPKVAETKSTATEDQKPQQKSGLQLQNVPAKNAKSQQEAPSKKQWVKAESPKPKEIKTKLPDEEPKIEDESKTTETVESLNTANEKQKSSKIETNNESENKTENKPKVLSKAQEAAKKFEKPAEKVAPKTPVSPKKPATPPVTAPPEPESPKKPDRSPKEPPKIEAKPAETKAPAKITPESPKEKEVLPDFSPKSDPTKQSLKMLQSMANEKLDSKSQADSNIILAKDSVKQKPLILRSRSSTIIKKQPKANLALSKPPEANFPAPQKALFMDNALTKLQEAFNKNQQQQQQPQKRAVKLKKMRAHTDLSCELIEPEPTEEEKKKEILKSQSTGGLVRGDRHTIKNMKYRTDRVSTVRHQALKMSMKNNAKEASPESSSDSDEDSDTETETETDSSGSDTETEEGQVKVDRNSTSSEDSGFGSNQNSPQASTNSAAQTLDVRDANSPNQRRLSTSLSTDSESGEEGHTRRYTPPARTIPRFRKYNVEDYQFLKVLGKGSFGKVLLAELKGTECYYAVKCLKKDVVLEDDDVECTLIERKVLALGTKHPYLCHLFCTFQTESHLFFVMEYLNGGDLMFHIQQSGRFEQTRACFYAAEIVSGLRFLHKKGIVYRDLKLDNILLDYEGHVRIADFGMCKLQIYLDRTADTFCGTPDYMAPEIIKGLHYNQCVDWWSFGVLLFEMLVGQSPFNGCDEDELFWCICNEQPYYPKYLSRESEEILVLLLQKDSSKRLGTKDCPQGEVSEQLFFRQIDWGALERKELEAPFKPRVQHSLDVQYFDSAFTKEVAKLTPVDKDILNSMDQTQFHGFSYTNPNACNE